MEGTELSEFFHEEMRVGTNLGWAKGTTGAGVSREFAKDTLRTGRKVYLAPKAGFPL